MSENQKIALHSGHRLIRDALAAYLGSRPSLVLVGATATLGELHRLCRLRRPDLVVVETTQLSVEVVQELTVLRAVNPQIEIVVIYTVLTGAVLSAAGRAGLTTLVPAARGLDGLLRAVRRQNPQPTPARPGGIVLTDREVEIVVLLAAGHSVAEMARLLDISPHTVDNHKRHLYAKLGVGSQAHAVARAESLGLVPSVRVARSCGPVTGERGRDPLVMLGGAHGDALDEVAHTLVVHGLTVVHSHRTSGNGNGHHGGTVRHQIGHEHWYGWHCGPLVAVLVEPGDADWAAAAAVGAPVVVVRDAPPDIAAVVDAVLRGAYAVLRRDQVPADLAAVLHLVGRGYLALGTEFLPDIADGLSGSPTGVGGVPTLTAREREILDSIADGHTVRQTAKALGIAAKTVENTQARLFRKLQVHNRTEAVHVAFRLGLVDSAHDK